MEVRQKSSALTTEQWPLFSRLPTAAGVYSTAFVFPGANLSVLTLPEKIPLSMSIVLPALSQAHTELQPLCTIFVSRTNKQMKTCLFALLQGPLGYSGQEL